VGAKTAILAFADGAIRFPVLSGAIRSEAVEVEDLVRRMFPGYQVASLDERTLWDSVYPDDDVTYATALTGVDLFCDGRLVLDRPSELPARFHEIAAGRRIIMHGMHSVVDWVCFAVWEDGHLVRSLSVSPGNGIQENIGDPFDFELPFWDGPDRVESVSGWSDQTPDRHPLPFHPLQMGEEALRALFGFVIEGYRSSEDLDTKAIPLRGFRVSDPSGREQAERAAMYERAWQVFGAQDRSA
jgi:hypothetical protein